MNLDNRNRGFGLGRAALLFLIIAIGLLLADNAGVLGNPINLVRNPIENLDIRADAARAEAQLPPDIVTAGQEIAALRAQIDNLQIENRRLRGIESEYGRLLELLDQTSDTPQYTRVAGNVIGRGINPAFKDIIIDKGSDDGIRVGMPVESAQGLVGQVFRTTPDSAQVSLIIDPNSRVPGRLFTGRATGIIQGQGSQGLILMDWIDPNAQIEINDDVITAGLDGSSTVEQIANRFPPDILIGQVVEIQSSGAALFQQVTIQPIVDFDNLETIFVITDFEPIDTAVFDSGQ